MLLNDTSLDAIHKIGETILRLLRDWSDRYSLHDVLVENEHNLVDVHVLVESECASIRTGTSRRV